MKELIDKRQQPKTERLKRNPVGFNFEREPFDPSSYYKSLNYLGGISRGATNVTKQEVANREASQRQRELEANQAAMRDSTSDINPNFTYSDYQPNTGGSRKYGLKGITSTTAKAADYFGNRYGIKTIGGWREHGSVPGSDHPKGRALDFMTNNIKDGMRKGNALANDLIRNYKKFNVKYVIWNKYIWQPGRGWKKYSGPSDHTDHVHASFNK